MSALCVDQVNTGHFKAGDQPTPVAVESKPLLARLMSHPAAHTLEHIEKQQRSVTPQPSHQSQSTTIPSTNKSKRRNKATPQQESIISTSAPISQDLPLSVTQNVNDSNGSTGFLRIQSPINVASSTLRNHQASNITNTNNANPLASLFAHASGSTVRKFLKIRFLSFVSIKYIYIYIFFFQKSSFFLFNLVIGRCYSCGAYVVRKRIGTSVNTTCDVCCSQPTRTLKQTIRTTNEKSAFTSVQLFVEKRSGFHQQTSRGLCQIVWRDTFLNSPHFYCINYKKPIILGCD